MTEQSTDYLECARMDIRGNSFLFGPDRIVVDMDDVDEVISTLKAERARSHRVSTPPGETAPEPYCYGREWKEDQPCNACDCYRPCGEQYLTGGMSEHDAAIAQAAREKVLLTVWERINRDLNNRFGNVRIDDVNKAIESLRQPEKKEVPE